jgi:hypothetical protein
MASNPDGPTLSELLDQFPDKLPEIPEIPEWARHCWPGIRSAAARLDFAGHTLMAVVRRLEHDLGVHIRYQITLPTNEAECTQSPLDVLADAAVSEADKASCAARLVEQRYGKHMRPEVRAAREDAARYVGSRQGQPQARIRVNGEDYLVGVADKLPLLLSPPIRWDWFWSEVDATLRGDRTPASEQPAPPAEVPTGRTLLTARHRPATARRQRRR